MTRLESGFLCIGDRVEWNNRECIIEGVKKDTNKFIVSMNVVYIDSDGYIAQKEKFMEVDEKELKYIEKDKEV